MTIWTYVRYINYKHFTDDYSPESFAPLELYEILPIEFITHPAVVHSVCIMLTLIIFMALIAIGQQLWLLHLMIFLSNKTTKERLGKKRNSRIDSGADTFSTTTSLLAEKVVDQIGRRQEATGWASCCKNFSNFFSATIKADCCMKDDNVGYQEQIIKELYLNAKERHGMEDDWGLVVKKLNSELEEDPSSSRTSDSND